MHVPRCRHAGSCSKEQANSVLPCVAPVDLFTCIFCRKRQSFARLVTTQSHAQLTARTQGNSYDCCHRFYGAPEYPLLIDPDEGSYRAVDKYLFADTTEILANTVIVDKEVRERKAAVEKAGSWLTNCQPC